MNSEITIEISDLIGGQNCISVQDGEKVYDKLEKFLREGKQVVLSFKGISLLIPLFLNVAIGRLYGAFSEDSIKRQLKVTNLAGEDKELLKYVVDNAKEYYSRKKADGGSALESEDGDAGDDDDE